MNKITRFLKCPMGISASLFILYSSHAIGATECYFTSNATDSLSFGWIGSVSPTGKVTSVTTLVDSFQDKIHIPQTDCNVGNDHDDLMSKQFGTALGMAGPEGEALFQTTVTGIVYSIKFKMDSTPPNGYIVTDKDYKDIYNDGESTDKEDFNKGQKGHYYLNIYQTSDYQPGAGHTVTPIPGDIGAFMIGTDTADNQRTVNMSTGSFSVDIPQPTCQQAVLTSSSTSSGNEVSLGDDYLTSDLKNNKSTRDIPFSVSLTGCAGANHVRATLAGSVSTHSNSMLVDMNNKEMGVGVQISGSNKIALIPNDSTSYYQIQDSATPDTRVMNFYATLMDDGKGTITTGAFKTMGTFTFTYN